MPAASTVHDRAAKAGVVVLTSLFTAYLIAALWPRPEPLDITPVVSPELSAPFQHVEPPSYTRYGR